MIRVGEQVSKLIVLLTGQHELKLKLKTLGPLMCKTLFITFEYVRLNPTESVPLNIITHCKRLIYHGRLKYVLE